MQQQGEQPSDNEETDSKEAMSDDEDQYEEGEEMEESSSSSSVYNSYGLIKEEFLENIDIDKNTI